MITLHFYLQPQFKYELFHIHFTTLRTVLPTSTWERGCISAGHNVCHIRFFRFFMMMNADWLHLLKVPITPKYFFRLNNSLHLFETHCTFLHLFSPNLDFLQAVKVTKSDHHLFHDRASKGNGSIPGLMSQTYLHACLQRLNTMQISL